MLQFEINCVFIVVLMAIGVWLESINGKHGFLDEFLTPFPMGAFGCFAAAIFERIA